MSTLSAGARAFLEAPGRYGVLATIDEDGSPLQAVVWYLVLDDGDLLVNSLVGRRWPTNLLRGPRCSLTVEDGYDYVSVRATAEQLHVGEAASRDIETLAHRYATGDDLGQRLLGFRGQDRISFRLRVRSVTTHH